MRSKAKIYPLAAAICYTVFGVYIAVELVGPNFRCGYYFAAFWDTLFFCGLIGLAAAHVFRSKKAAIAAAGAIVLYRVYRLILWFCAWNLFGLLSAAALLLILILAQKGSAAVKKLWFVPEVLMFIMQIVYISDTFSLLISNFYYFWAVLCTRGLPYSLICIAGLDLTGTWLRDTTIAE